MSLLTILDAELAFGLQPLLDRASLTIQSGDRIGLIGRNGTGKSSLLNAIAGHIELDDGEIKRKDALSIALVEQEPVLPLAPTLRASLVLRGAIETHAYADERERWRVEARLIEYMHRLGLDEAADPAGLSGGQRKRGALALAFALTPDLMLLDEPTNHLDIDGIMLVEELLAKQTLIVITHDRAFLDRVATQIVELDRGMLRSYPGNYSAWESRRAVELAAEQTAARKFDKFWQQEEVWIRRGVEARRTRNAGRVVRLDQLRRERLARRERAGNIKLSVDAGERSGKLVAELTDVSKSFSTTIVDRLSMRIGRGDRIGLIGPNGAGKTTLLRLMLGTLAPDSGTVRVGTHVNVAYFDQMRDALDPEATVAETISPGSDWIEIGRERKHVMTYLGDFLFPPQRAQAPVKTLSGGERNRLLLARLFARPANLLVLDEPTNDLDIESLELLEATLQEYSGTLLLVSHDRAFLDNVVTQTLVAEGRGAWREYVGGYSDWLQQRPRAPNPIVDDSGAAAVGAKRPRTQTDRLSYKEQRQLIALPIEIESLEDELREITVRMNQGDYHRAQVDLIKTDRARIEAIEHAIAAKFEQWSSLEQRSRVA